MSEQKRSLYYLNELSDYRVASGYSDVRGWEIIDADNMAIGRVSNLLVSKKDERVVYLDVEVDESLQGSENELLQEPAASGIHGFVNRQGEDHLIVPVGMVRLDEENKKVITDHIDHKTFDRAKRFRKGADIDRDYELALLRHYTGDATDDRTDLDDRFYARKEFTSSMSGKESEQSR
jgi:sporulation protein YlmC with PRC-barrel domain